MHHDPPFWLLARASGLTAYALLTLSVLAGLLVKSRPFAQLKAATATEVHKTIALTGLGALALHGASLVLDSTVRITPTALLVPGLVAYRPVAVASVSFAPGPSPAFPAPSCSASAFAAGRGGSPPWPPSPPS